MSATRILLVTLLAVLAGIGVGVVSQHWLQEEGEVKSPVSLAGTSEADRLDRIPEFQLPDVNGQLVSSSRWAGKVLVLNFWATWCPPCLRELPLLDALQSEHEDGRLQVVGIAIDNREDVERFLAEHPIGFPILIGDTGSIEMSRKLGNSMQGLPFTAVFDRHGQRIYTRAGELTRASLSEHLAPLLNRSEGPSRPERVRDLSEG